MDGLHVRSRSAALVADVHAARISLAETATRLDRSGDIFAAAYLRSACGNADRAIEAMCALAAREESIGSGADRSVERIVTLSGFQTGVALRRSACGTLAVRCRIDPEGRMVEESDADADVAVLEAPDLGWDLLHSPEAAALAAGDVAAGLLVRGLSRTTWLHSRSRCRWSASRSGVAMLVRLLRRGRSAPDLAEPVGCAVIDTRVSELITSLGWHPHNPASRMDGDLVDEEPGTLH